MSFLRLNFSRPGRLFLVAALAGLTGHAQSVVRVDFNGMGVTALTADGSFPSIRSDHWARTDSAGNPLPADAPRPAPPDATGGAPFTNGLRDAYGPSVQGYAPNLANRPGTVISTGYNTSRNAYTTPSNRTASHADGHAFNRPIFFLRTTPDGISSGGSTADRPSAWGALDAWIALGLGGNAHTWRRLDNTLTLRSMILPNRASHAGDNRYGFGLGFFSATPDSTSPSWTQFTGLVVQRTSTAHPSPLQVRLIVDGVATSVLGSIGGGFNSGGWEQFAYTINTVTGAITSVTYGGTPISLTGFGVGSNPSNTVFSRTTPGRTNLFGAYTVVAAPDGQTRFGNFPKFDDLELIPEPSAYALLAGALGLALVVYRRRSCRSPSYGN